MTMGAHLFLKETGMGPAPGQSKCYCSRGLSQHNKGWAMMLCNVVKNLTVTP